MTPKTQEKKQEVECPRKSDVETTPTPSPSEPPLQVRLGRWWLLQQDYSGTTVMAIALGINAGLLCRYFDIMSMWWGFGIVFVASMLLFALGHTIVESYER